MNIIGLLIGIAMWVAVLFFIPSVPTWMQSIIRILILLLVILLIARVYQRWSNFT